MREATEKYLESLLFQETVREPIVSGLWLLLCEV